MFVIKTSTGLLKPNCNECKKHYMCSGPGECNQILLEKLYEKEDVEMLNMEDFIEKNKGKLFRYWMIKRNWTPYEMELKDPDQSDLIDDTCSYGYFVDCVDLGYDHLIGISEDSADSKYISYHKLSLLDFALNEEDQE